MSFIIKRKIKMLLFTSIEPNKLVWGYDHGLAIEGSNPKGTRLYFVILLKNVEKYLMALI